VDIDAARDRLYKLQVRLAEIVRQDPEQEVRGIALPVLDAVISSARPFVKSDDPVASAIQDVINPDAIAAGDLDEVRALDALFVVDQLLASLPPVDIGPLVVGESVFKREDFNF
jgi:hypothetical protein